MSIAQLCEDCCTQVIALRGFTMNAQAQGYGPPNAVGPDRYLTKTASGSRTISIVRPNTYEVEGFGTCSCASGTTVNDAHDVSGTNTYAAVEPSEENPNPDPRTLALPIVPGSSEILTYDANGFPCTYSVEGGAFVLWDNIGVGHTIFTRTDEDRERTARAQSQILRAAVEVAAMS